MFALNAMDPDQSCPKDRDFMQWWDFILSQSGYEVVLTREFDGYVHQPKVGIPNPKKRARKYDDDWKVKSDQKPGKRTIAVTKSKAYKEFDKKPWRLCDKNHPLEWHVRAYKQNPHFPCKSCPVMMYDGEWSSYRTQCNKKRCSEDRTKWK